MLKLHTTTMFTLYWQNENEELCTYCMLGLGSGSDDSILADCGHSYHHSLPVTYCLRLLRRRGQGKRRTLPSRLRMTTCRVVCSAGTTFRVVFVTRTSCRVVCRARTTHGIVISTRTTHGVVYIRQRKMIRAKAVMRRMGRMRAKAVTRGMARISWRVRMRRRAGMRARGTRASSKRRRRLRRQRRSRRRKRRSRRRKRRKTITTRHTVLAVIIANTGLAMSDAIYALGASRAPLD
jgi:hypothetical protein